MNTAGGIILMIVLLLLLLLLLLGVAFIATLLVADSKHSIVLEREDDVRGGTNPTRVTGNQENRREL